MAQVCPVCSSPVDGAYCSTCGTPSPATSAPAPSQLPKKAIKVEAEHEPSAPVRDPKRAVPKASPRTAVQAPQRGVRMRAGSGAVRNRVTLGLIGLLLVGAGFAAGYGLSTAVSSAGPAAASSTEPAIEAASRFLDDGTDLIGQGAKDKAIASFRKSEQSWQTVLKNDPGNLFAKTYLSLTQYYLGNPTKALATAREVLSQDPNYLWALFNLAWMSETSGQIPDAYAYYKRYVDAAPTESTKAGKYEEQPGLIDRQLAVALEAVAKLKGDVAP